MARFVGALAGVALSLLSWTARAQGHPSGHGHGHGATHLVPELDPATAGAALALVVFGALLLVEQRRRLD